MDDELVDRLAFTATADDCARRLLAYRGLADEAIVLDVGADRAGVLALPAAWARATRR